MSSFVVTIGSYETPVYGFQGDIRHKGEEDYSLSMRELFAHSSHSGCIKAVASSGKWLASASTDETVKVYDVRKRREFGTLMQGEGLATCLEFFSKTHLFVGLSNGNIVIFDTTEWESQKTMKGHKNAVNSIAIHPSGLLALSVSKDCTMRLWALKKGTCTHTEKLPYHPDLIRWSPKGENYAILSDTKIFIYNKDGSELRTLQEKKKILSVHYILDNFIATGGEEHVVNIWDLSKGEIVFTLKGFQNRIKSIVSVPKKALLPADVPDDIRENVSELPYIFTVSSDEFLRVWDLDFSTDRPIVQKNLRARPTCMTVSLVKRVSDEEVKDLIEKQKQDMMQKLKAHLRNHSDSESDDEEGVKKEEADEKKPIILKNRRERVIVTEEAPAQDKKAKKPQQQQQQEKKAASPAQTSNNNKKKQPEIKKEESDNEDEEEEIEEAPKKKAPLPASAQPKKSILKKPQSQPQQKSPQAQKKRPRPDASESAKPRKVQKRE